MKTNRLLNRVAGLFCLTSILWGQYAWNTGEISFSYGSPIPDQQLSLTGDLLPDAVPDQGVGGFEISQGDTNLIMLVAQNTYVLEEDTLADIFILFMNDTLPMEPGTYLVNPSPEALKLFVWMREIDPDVLPGLINADFTIDSLASLNPFISISGQFDIVEINAFQLQMNFAGMMFSPSFETMSILNGAIHTISTFPVSVYSQGALDYVEGGESGNISGELNPLINSEGVGAVRTEVQDTITYNLISYHEMEENRYDVFGVTLVGDEASFLATTADLEFPISILENEFPMAVPFMLKNVAVQDVLELLESGEMPSPDSLSQIYLPISQGTAYLNFTDVGDASLDFENITMSNITGDFTQLSENWILGNSSTNSIDGKFVIQIPDSPIVGAPYPNPFNSSTIIPVNLTRPMQLDLEIYNILGQNVAYIRLGEYSSGSHHIPLNMGLYKLSGGLYYFSFRGNTQILDTGSFLYLK